jgi:hypothetical protein
VAQDVGPERKLQFHKKKKEEEEKSHLQLTPMIPSHLLPTAQCVESDKEGTNRPFTYGVQ